MQNGQRINNLQTRDSVSAVGDIVITLNSTPQGGRLFMDGSTYSKDTYPFMWQHVVDNPAYGTYDTDTFTLTDMRGHVPVGKQDVGTFDTLGNKLGEETHVLTEAEMPTHNHRFINGRAVPAFDEGANAYTYNTSDSGNGIYALRFDANTTLTEPTHSETTGNGETHNNIQPSIVVNFEVKAR